MLCIRRLWAAVCIDTPENFITRWFLSLDSYEMCISSAVRALNRNKVISWSNWHHVMLHPIKHGQPMVFTPGLQWLPLQIVHHCCHAGCSLVSVACKLSSTSLDLFQFMGILHSVGIPSSGGILHHWAYKSGVTCSLDLLRTWVNVPCSECSVDVSQICYLGCRPTRTCQTRT